MRHFKNKKMYEKSKYHHTGNYFYCSAANKAKYLFQSEQKAMTAIPYTSEANGKAMRSYYCNRCQGWHLTSTQFYQSRAQYEAQLAYQGFTEIMLKLSIES
ncbi:MAG: hypothetical protein FWF42_04150, partial [Streptococcaceae bacterium]|nr:hypothetical protein [Streptococcaceae bacterium]MCL2680984.1 hypothetical protein [Streptococcaceae bacterium]MCL2858866.1 hypothetical protein [Streptococcaceae bacterium]